MINPRRRLKDMSDLCLVHSPDGANWAEYTTSKLLSKFPGLKVATVPDERAFSNCTGTQQPIPDSQVIILIASPDLLDYLRVHSDVVFNGKVDRFVKHCLVLLLGLDKEEMDEKGDHFPQYEKWTHLTLTEDQEDLVGLFQKIIEIMQDIMNSRTIRQQQQQQQQKPAITKPKPKPKPKHKPLVQQHCLDVASSGDELERDTAGCQARNAGRNMAGKIPEKSSDNVPGDDTSESPSHDLSNTLVVPRDSGDSPTVNVTPATPQPEEPSPAKPQETDDDIYSRNLTFVKGTALLKTECGTEGNDSDNKPTNLVVKRETDTDNVSIYENAERYIADSRTELAQADTKSSDYNDNLVTQIDGMLATDSAAEDTIDGPSAHSGLVVAWDDSAPAGHRPRSGRVSDKDGKRFHRRSAALCFTLSPAVIDGDDDREVLLVFDRALRGDLEKELQVMLAGVPDYPPRTLHSVMTNPYNIKVQVPKLQPGRVQLRLMKKDITCGSHNLDVISSNCEMIGLSQLYLTTLQLVCGSQRGGSPGPESPGYAQRMYQREGSTSSTESDDSAGPRRMLDKHIIQLFSNDDIPVQAFEKVFGIYEEFVLRDETMNGDLPSLLHFGARYGLCELVSRLIDLPSAREVCNLKNRDGYKPVDLAILYKHTELADFLEQYSKTSDTREEIYEQMRRFFERRASRTSMKDVGASDSGRRHGRKNYNERSSRGSSQPPTLPEDNESDAQPVKTTNKKGRRLDKIVPPPPAPCPKGPAGYVNAPNADSGYVNAPRDDEDVYVNSPGRTCAYDNAHVASGGVDNVWDAPVPKEVAPGVGIGRQDSYLEPVSPCAENYELMNSEDMTECDRIRADMHHMRSESEEDLYMSMNDRTDSGDYMSMGGVRKEMNSYVSMRGGDSNLRSNATNSYINAPKGSSRRTDSNYMHMDDKEINEAATNDYLQLTADQEDLSTTIPVEYLTQQHNEPSWDEEVPLTEPLSPRNLLQEIQGDPALGATSLAAPPPCAPLPGYVSMGGGEQGSKKHGYVNEDVLLRQRTDSTDDAMYDTMAQTDPSAAPPPPFHENSFSGKDEPNTIKHDPSIGNVTGDMFHSHSQKELLDILNMAKHKEINIHEAELLFSSWQQQYNSGNTTSFRDKKDQMKQMQDEFDEARRKIGGTGGGGRKGIFSRFFNKNPRKKSESNSEAEQMKRLTKSTGSESSLTDSVDGSVETISAPYGVSKTLEAVKERSRLSTVSNSSSSSNGSRMSCGSISSTHDSGIDELHQQERNSVNLAEEVVKSDVYKKPPPVPMRKQSARNRPLPPVPGDSGATSTLEPPVSSTGPPASPGGPRALPPTPSPGGTGVPSAAPPAPRRGGAIPTPTVKRGSSTSSRIPAMHPHCKAKSQEALDTASSGSTDDLTSSGSADYKPQTLPKPRRAGYELVVTGLTNNPIFNKQRKLSQNKTDKD